MLHLYISSYDNFKRYAPNQSQDARHIHDSNANFDVQKERKTVTFEL